LTNLLPDSDEDRFHYFTDDVGCKLVNNRERKFL
jgi:hypothetical protein